LKSYIGGGGGGGGGEELKFLINANPGIWSQNVVFP